ncbi:hypothetical protein AVEN_189883-1 [Araneus ventricosus]|uniref:Uncharacterized protein n=1 Tax=Araneus ventricosus TaxID=182803 RepID=A0A4Y2EGV6_ARAVE|nr:hypothetical protein AVEN_189883-1 [Araneus ventricosus]
MFVHSFNQSNCLFVGVECTNWNDFLRGRCNCGATGERCSFMGFFATPRPPLKRRYYLQVAFDVPFCREYHFLHSRSFTATPLPANDVVAHDAIPFF